MYVVLQVRIANGKTVMCDVMSIVFMEATAIFKFSMGNCDM
jgi:hypothetical protein